MLVDLWVWGRHSLGNVEVRNMVKRIYTILATKVTLGDSRGWLIAYAFNMLYHWIPLFGAKSIQDYSLDTIWCTVYASLCQHLICVLWKVYYVYLLMSNALSNFKERNHCDTCDYIMGLESWVTFWRGNTCEYNLQFLILQQQCSNSCGRLLNDGPFCITSRRQRTISGRPLGCRAETIYTRSWTDWKVARRRRYQTITSHHSRHITELWYRTQFTWHFCHNHLFRFSLCIGILLKLLEEVSCRARPCPRLSSPSCPWCLHIATIHNGIYMGIFGNIFCHNRFAIILVGGGAAGSAVI